MIKTTLWTAACVITSCGRAPPVDQQRGEPSGALPVAATSSARRRAFDLVPVAPARDAAARPAPALTFFTPHITKGSRFEVKDLDVIVRHASFVAADGSALPVRAEETAPQQHPEQGHYFVLTPGVPLERTGKYELQIEEDDAVRVLAPARFHTTRDGHTIYKVDLAKDHPVDSGNARDDVSRHRRATD